MKINKSILVCSGLILMSLSSALLADTNSNADTASSPWMIRLRGIDVVPVASSDTIPDIGGHVTNASSAIVPELDINYFFTPHISTELILATSEHDVTATHTTLGNVDLGSVRVLPPTLTAVYHFLPNSKFDPYVGAGINFTYFYDIDNGPVANSITYSNSFGPALQVGADYAISKHVYLNADIKRVYMSTDADVQALGLSMKTDVNLSPWIFGLGIGYRF